MVFSSHLFVFYFLPLALALYYAAPKRMRLFLLALLSYLFYGWENPAFCLVMAFSTAVDYSCGLWIGAARRAGRDRSARYAVACSVITNLALLGFFKYFNFAADSARALLTLFGVDSAAATPMLRVTLPLGISFYTFQSMSYSIDLYRGLGKPLRNPIDFAAYVSLFPQLVAGPIVRFHEIADQLHDRSHTLAKLGRGIAFMSLGLGKKILLANPCGQLADRAFGADTLHVVDAWLGALAYGFQIYFDFSGYSDMAIGLGLMIGFTLPQNFDSPYRSASITEFWRRWHMSLSRWLRDYLYLPLGGNRRGPGRTWLNLWLVMLLGGLWHGAAWNFVVWGAYHGGLLALERRLGKEPLYASLPRPGRVALTFILVTIGWVFFRADSLAHAIRYLGFLCGLGAGPQAALVSGTMLVPYLLATLLCAATLAWTAPTTWKWTATLTLPRAAFIGGALFAALAVMETQGYNPFLYFIF